ncbi:DUF2158 domain-containing protein [Brucella pseudogrignonensis]|uniref:YodC family protein n=1 Tax=Brucella pseudogrignonensis TaxID=419475 RepID=UPI001EDC07F3|nr:DUF2158 domain-containing protein [Brucella pseudogrignonensis]UKK92054.1 DUF2158 domain-containing protein [Brucella pseudogrignonensis]
MSFKVGDTVRLKSGGPLMTVERINENKSVTCIWFQDNKQNRSIFQPDTLKDDKETSSKLSELGEKLA